MGCPAEVQRRQAVFGQQARAGPVLQQQLGAVAVAVLAGLVQRRLAARQQVGPRPVLQQVAQALGVALGGRDAKRAGQLPLILQGPQACKSSERKGRVSGDKIA